MADLNKNTDREEPRFRLRSLFYMLGAILLLLAVFSHDAGDIAILKGGASGVVGNWIGNWGAAIACKLFFSIGLAAYVLAIIVLLAAIRTFLPQKLSRTWLFLPGVILTVLGSSILLAFDPASFAQVCENIGIGRSQVPELSLSGGVIGQKLTAPSFGNIDAGPLRQYLGPVGSMLVSSALLLAGLIMLYRSDWHSVLVSLVDRYLVSADDSSRGSKKEKERIQKESLLEKARRLLPESAPEPAPEPAAPAAVQPVLSVNTLPEEAAAAVLPAQEDDSLPGFAPEPETEHIAAPLPVQNATAEPTPSPMTLPTPALVEAGEKGGKVKCADYVLPQLPMLGKGSEISGEKPEVIAQNKAILQSTLESFKVDGQVVGHVSGPRVTRYEIRLAPSVKVNKVTEIENNIAMTLKARSLRILAPIPGRDVIGVEVPNTNAEAIMMRSVMESSAWQDSKMEIPIALGKDISGKPVVLDLAKAPHLLIAGATGSGKSVCMNTLIMSLLMKFTPDELRLIMVDPKVVEMADYQTLPHLITPVIHDSKKVPLALRWATSEMDKRYLWLAKTGVKKLKDFNNRQLPETPVLDDDGLPIPDKLPVLIVIIDELADLMVTDARSDIETSISRIAAKGRAAGVHIVVATQRPSKDVITGTIKGNLPTRIAFRVVSYVDSRVILDQKGAESLLGMGDMLLLAPNSAEIERIQGALVADEDIKNVVRFVSDQVPQQFDQQVVIGEEDEESDSEPSRGREPRGGFSGGDADIDDDGFDDINPLVVKYMQPEDDQTLRKALEIVLLEKKASTSYIQRRLKIGYNRAAELIDIMEERGIVGPPSGSGAKRDILVFDDIINE